MEQVLSTLNTISQAIPWDLVMASGILSPAVLLVKKWLHLQSEKVMMTLVLVLSMIGSAVTYILSTNSADPSIIAVQGLMVAAMSQPVFFLVVKPFSVWFGGELAKARAFDAEVKSAAIPASGLPVSNQQ
jgi:hypothetical protein